MDIKFRQLSKRLNECYSRDLCYPKIKDKWNENNKCLGMCAITALVVNDYFGGEICKIYVGDLSHYFNLIEDKIIDLTASQFSSKIDYSGYEIIRRNDVLTGDTPKRYVILKQKLAN